MRPLLNALPSPVLKNPTHCDILKRAPCGLEVATGNAGDPVAGVSLDRPAPTRQAVRPYRVPHKVYRQAGPGCLETPAGGRYRHRVLSFSTRGRCLRCVGYRSTGMLTNAQLSTETQGPNSGPDVLHLFLFGDTVKSHRALGNWETIDSR